MMKESGGSSGRRICECVRVRDKKHYTDIDILDSTDIRFPLGINIFVHHFTSV
jgi:hypothetical protein